jgi:hypothetical protein
MRCSREEEEEEEEEFETTASPIPEETGIRNLFSVLNYRDLGGLQKPQPVEVCNR